MYISVETYEEMYLKGKDAETVGREVEKLRNEIARIKRKMESPSYVYAERSYPSDDRVIEICRGYFERAASALAELLGVESVLNEEEKSAKFVDAMSEDISSLTLTVGRYLENKYEIYFTPSSAKITALHLGEEPTVTEAERDLLMDGIAALHLGEWRQLYLPEDYGCTLNEPTKWQLRVEYYGGAAPRFYDGLGIFPYNFSSLCKLLGAEIF